MSEIIYRLERLFTLSYIFCREKDEAFVAIVLSSTVLQCVLYKLAKYQKSRLSVNTHFPAIALCILTAKHHIDR